MIKTFVIALVSAIMAAALIKIYDANQQKSTQNIEKSNSELIHIQDQSNNHSTQDDLAKDDSSQDSPSKDNSSQKESESLFFATKVLEYHLPDKIADLCIKEDNCPQIEIHYLDSNKEWINTQVNKAINDMIINDVGMSANEDDPEDDAPLKRRDLSNNPKERITQVLNAFVTSQFTRKDSFAYSLTIKPRYLGHIGHLEEIALEADIYTGGAHGMPFEDRLIFDESEKRRLTLDDVLIEGKKPELEKLAYQAYKDYVQKDEENNLSDYEEMWPFHLSKVFSFDKKGMVFLYQPYEIASYAEGMPELTIDYQKLNGIIQDKYLN